LNIRLFQDYTLLQVVGLLFYQKFETKNYVTISIILLIQVVYT